MLLSEYFFLILVFCLIQVICAKCSEFKTLADNSRQNRVCKDCFQLPSANLCISGTEGTGEQRKKITMEVYLSCLIDYKPADCLNKSSFHCFFLVLFFINCKQQQQKSKMKTREKNTYTSIK